MQDDDCDNLIDCADPDCATVTPCRPARKDPTTVRFSPGLDRFRSQATLDMAPVDVTGARVAVLLTNPNGAIYRGVLAGSALTPSANGTIYRFRDTNARSGGGIYSLKIKQHKDGSGYTFRVESYADLSAATDPLMLVQFYVAQDVFITSPAPWTRIASGWRAPKDH